MSWPLPQDYNEAIQSPGVNFADPELCRGQPVTNALGIPLPRSGTFADVYQLRCPGGDFAVKCFTRNVPGLCERYAAVGKHLRSAALPFTVDFQFLPEGIRVQGRWYPVVKMRWVEGLLLNHFVRDNLEKPANLAALADVWLRMARRLRTSSVAHGDLQHGNVILTPERDGASHAVKLVDYDGMWVTALAGQKSGEVGHPNYQHPRRLREGTYGPEVDRFPLLVIYCAIRGLLVGGRGLWERYDNGDNLLFREVDLCRPRGSALVWELARLDDPDLRLAVDALSRAAYKPLDEVPHLADLLPGNAAAPARKRPTKVVLPPPGTAQPPPAPGGSKRSRVWLVPAAAGVLTLVAAAVTIFFLARHLVGRHHPTTEPLVAQRTEAPAAEGVPAEAGPRPAPEPERAADPERLPEPAPDPEPGPPAQTKPPAPPEPKPEPKPSPPQAKPEPKPKPEDRPPDPKPAPKPEPNPKGPPAEKRPPAGPAQPRVVHTFAGHTAGVLCVAFSPDGSHCVSGDKEGGVRLWDLETGKEQRSFTLGPHPVTAVAFSDDGGEVYAAGPVTGPEEKVRSFRYAAWFSDTGEARFSKQVTRGLEQGEGAPVLLAFAPAESRLALVESFRPRTGLPHCRALTFDLANPQVRPPMTSESQGGATCVALSPDGTLAVTGGGRGDAALRLWDLKRQTVKAVGRTTAGTHCVALSHDLRYALTDHRGSQVQVWELTPDKVVRGRVLGALPGHTGAITCLALAPDGRHALSAGRDRTVRLWDVRTGRELCWLKGHADVVHDLAFSPDGRLALTGGADKAVRVWELPAATAVAKAPEVRYLSDMEESEADVPEGRLGKKGNLTFGVRPSNRIQVNGKETPHGLSLLAAANASATVKYELEKGGQTFLASVALDDAAGAPKGPPGRGKIPTPLTFVVLGDDKVLWKSRPVDTARSVQECKVDVSGVGVLELRVDCPGPAGKAHAVWLEPRVELKP